MAAFTVTPMAGVHVVADSHAFAAMASAIALVASLVVGTGISTLLVERRTHRDSQDQLVHIAMHDTLTELANRLSFSERWNGNARGWTLPDRSACSWSISIGSSRGTTRWAIRSATWCCRRSRCG